MFFFGDAAASRIVNYASVGVFYRLSHDCFKFLVLMWMLGPFCENDFFAPVLAAVIVLSLFFVFNKQLSLTAFVTRERLRSRMEVFMMDE